MDICSGAIKAGWDIPCTRRYFFDGRNHGFDSGGSVDGFEVLLTSPQNIEVRQKSLEDGV